MARYPITTRLKRQLADLTVGKWQGRVWVRTWASGTTLVGVRWACPYTVDLYEALKTRCRELGYTVCNEGKPGTVGDQSFQVLDPL